MKIRPILFSTPMVEAILEKRKTQTRRTQGLKIINEEPERYMISKAVDIFNVDDLDALEEFELRAKFKAGDILWVRETFRYAHHYGIDYEFVQYKDGSTNTHCEIPDKDQILHDDKWKPSIFMPKAACRIFLEVTDVRAERLHDISEEDAIAEGIIPLSMSSMQMASYGQLYFDYSKPKQFFKEGVPSFWSFNSLWCSINGTESWEADPFVFVYDFKRVEKPENFLV